MRIECCVPVTGVDENKERNARMVNPQTNRIRLSVDYNLGGLNCFTYKNELRGYYLHATPEYAHGYMTQCMLGTGVKHGLSDFVFYGSAACCRAGCPGNGGGY